jgi:hypothetical protein
MTPFQQPFSWLAGYIPDLPTPFDDDGELDLAAFDPKILKTTPCKVAGGRHGDFESTLTRRANHGHSFIIPKA